jgi:hypothetical protein
MNPRSTPIPARPAKPTGIEKYPPVDLTKNLIGNRASDRVDFNRILFS